METNRTSLRIQISIGLRNIFRDRTFRKVGTRVIFFFSPFFVNLKKEKEELLFRLLSYFLFFFFFSRFFRHGRISRRLAVAEFFE